MSTTSSETAGAADSQQLDRHPDAVEESAFDRLDRGKWIERLLGYVAVLGVWQLVSTYIVEQFILPPPTIVAQRMWELLASGDLWFHGIYTFERIFLGFFITLVLGTAIGVMMGSHRWFDGFFRDGLLIIFTTPGLIVVLLSLLAFGISYIGPLFSIVLISLPYVAINVWEGVRAVPRDLIDMSQSFGMSRSYRIRHVVIPSVAPYLFQGMRFGFAISWKIAMLAEIFGSNRGIGFSMRVAHQQFQIRGLIAWTLWFFVIALILERGVLQRLINHSLRWRPDSMEAAR